MTEITHEVRVRLLNYWVGGVFFVTAIIVAWIGGLTNELSLAAVLAVGASVSFLSLYVHGALSMIGLLISVRRVPKAVASVMTAGSLSLLPPIAGYITFSTATANFLTSWRFVLGSIVAGLLYVGFSIAAVSLIRKRKM